MGKKIRCKNCGTAIKDDEKSCSVCRMVPEVEETKEEEASLNIKTKTPAIKIVMVVLILIGIVLTIKGIVEYQNVDVCTANDCGFRSLFLAGVGIILIIAASIELARGGLSYKIKYR